MGATTLAASIQLKTSYKLTKAQQGVAALDTGNQAVNKQIAYALGSAAAGKANEVYATVLSIPAASATTLDLSALTDVLNGSVNFARINGVMLWLLGTGETAPDGVTLGNAASSVTAGNAATNSFQAPFSDQATGTFTLYSGSAWAHTKADATGWLRDATHKSLKILNNDGALAANVMVVLVGADA